MVLPSSFCYWVIIYMTVYYLDERKIYWVSGKI